MKTKLTLNEKLIEIKCGTIMFLMKKNPKNVKGLKKHLKNFLKLITIAKKCLDNIQKYRNKYPNEHPTNIRIIHKRGDCNYCESVSDIRARVAIRDEKNKYYTGAACLKCVSSFLPKETQLVEVKL